MLKFSRTAFPSPALWLKIGTSIVLHSTAGDFTAARIVDKTRSDTVPDGHGAERQMLSTFHHNRGSKV